MLAGEDVAGAAHVGRELVDLGEAAIDDAATFDGIAKIGDDEIVGRRRRELGKLEIDGTNPKSLGLEALNQMRSDEAATATNQC